MIIELYNDGKNVLIESYVKHCGSTYWLNGKYLRANSRNDAIEKTHVKVLMGG